MANQTLVEALNRLQDQMRNTSTVMGSADVYIKGVPGLINDAVQKAIGNGATAEQLQPFVELGNELQARGEAITADITANTPEAGGGGTPTTTPPSGMPGAQSAPHGTHQAQRGTTKK